MVSNQIDGSIIAFEPDAGGLYVTVAGGADGPVQVLFPKGDLGHLVAGAGAVAEFGESLADLSQGDRIRITDYGVRKLRESL